MSADINVEVSVDTSPDFVSDTHVVYQLLGGADHPDMSLALRRKSG